MPYDVIPEERAQPSGQWFVVRTKVNAETKAAFHLRNQGFSVYTPRYGKTVRHARQVSRVLRPLFPGYLFVFLGADTPSWHSIRSTVGVIGLVQFGMSPEPVPGAVIDMLRERENENGMVRLLPRNLTRGTPVRMIDGCFADYTALLEDISDEHRAILLIDFMGRQIRVQAPLQQLALA